MLQAAWTKNDKKARALIFTFSAIVFTAIVLLSRITLHVNLGFDVHLFAKANAVINSAVAVLLLAALVAVKSAADPEPLIAMGRWQGQILPALQGGGGFGYDPLLFIPALGKSVGQLSVAEKNTLSHRALSAADLAVQMREVWHLG